MSKPQEVKTYNWLAEAGYEIVRTRPSWLPGFAVLQDKETARETDEREVNDG